MNTTRTDIPHSSRYPTWQGVGSASSTVRHAWSSIWLGPSLAITMSLAGALLVAALMPRGPITTGQALILLATGVVLGVGAGLVMRSRWAMLVAPVTFIATLEVALRSGDSIVFDAPRFDMTYGVVAFILGRGFVFLVGVVPMLLGVAYGAGLARRIERGPGREQGGGARARRIMGAGATIGVIGLAVLIALPANVPALLDAEGHEVPSGHVELTAVPLGGHEQWISVRATDFDAPVVLWLSGGPGQSDLAFTRALFDPIAEDVVFVNWDQRGAGKSRPALDPASTWTLDQAVADTIELTNYLRERFDEDKIYLVGESWGTTLGVLAVHQRPDLYHAYVDSGQMVSQRETDRIIYHDVLDHAVSTGDRDLQATLEGFGEPPYRDVWAYTFMLEQYEVVEPEYNPPAVYLERGNRANIGPWGVLASEYTFVEKVNVLAGALEMFATMYPQLQEVDFRVDVPQLDVPVYIMLGEAELEGRASLAREWFDLLQAPAKELLVIEHAGHSTALEGVDTFHRLLVEEVIPATYPQA